MRLQLCSDMLTLLMTRAGRRTKAWIPPSIWCTSMPLAACLCVQGLYCGTLHLPRCVQRTRWSHHAHECQAAATACAVCSCTSRSHTGPHASGHTSPLAWHLTWLWLTVPGVRLCGASMPRMKTRASLPARGARAICSTQGPHQAVSARALAQGPPNPLRTRPGEGLLSPAALRYRSDPLVDGHSTQDRAQTAVVLLGVGSELCPDMRFTFWSLGCVIAIDEQRQCHRRAECEKKCQPFFPLHKVEGSFSRLQLLTCTQEASAPRLHLQMQSRGMLPATEHL